MNSSKPLIDASLLLFHSYSCLFEDFDVASFGLDGPVVLNSVAIFVTLLELIAAETQKISTEQSVEYSNPSLIGAIVTLFRDTQRPLTEMPEAYCRAVDELQGRFHSICESVQCWSDCGVSVVEDYLRTAIEFCWTSAASSLLVPEWCRNTTNRAKKLLQSQQDLGSVWISELVRYQSDERASCTIWPPLLKLLHDEIVRHAWSSPKPQCLVQLLVDLSGEYEDRSFLDCILLSSLPTHTFRVRHPDDLVGAFDSALRLSHDSVSATAHLFLGAALRLESLSCQTAGSADVRNRCYQIARKFLLDKRRDGGWQKALYLCYDWVFKKLSIEGASLGKDWWEEACCDLLHTVHRTAVAEKSFELLVDALGNVIDESTRKRPVGVVSRQSPHPKRQRSFFATSTASVRPLSHRGLQRRSAPVQLVKTKPAPALDSSPRFGRDRRSTNHPPANDATEATSQADDYDEEAEDEILFLDV